MKNLVVAAKLRDGKWRGALIVDGEFKDAMIESVLADLVADAISAVLAIDYPEGQEVSINLVIQSPPAQRQNPTEGPNGQG